MSMMKDWGAPILVAVVSAAAAFGAGVYGTQVNKDVEDRKLDIQMVEIALALLRSDSEDAELQSARAFAIKALQQYSGVSLGDGQWTEWERSGSVPALPQKWLDWPKFDPERQNLMMLPVYPPLTVPIEPAGP